jgi:uncharacterized protein YprB with RNaseH-like and TPR domain
MTQNLGARLSRIRNAKKENAANTKKSDTKTPGRGTAGCDSHDVIPPGFSAWQEDGYKVLSRVITVPIKLSAPLPEMLPSLIPDLAYSQTDDNGTVMNGNAIDIERFLFFDLETTGLSGGAGTTAFLSAFGHFVRDTKKTSSLDYSSLEVTQILLLDYPGEPDFLERTLSIMLPQDSKDPYLTTYNGKAFDVPILKSRCVVNRCDLPAFKQVDLLHPARRMWKRILPNCSQATIETLVLGLDRDGDTPGSLAPEIWFNFLNNGGKESAKVLLGICDHNVKDIVGLASLFCAFTEIAANPLKASLHFRCDEENLAIKWRHMAGLGALPAIAQAASAETAALLLESAAEHYPRACLRLGFDFFRQRRYEEGRALFHRIAEDDVSWKVPCTITVQALALRSLAIDAERRLRQLEAALSYVKRALELEEDDETAKLPGGLKDWFENFYKRGTV